MNEIVIDTCTLPAALSGTYQVATLALMDELLHSMNK